jgi:hypothetical protein
MNPPRWLIYTLIVGALIITVVATMALVILPVVSATTEPEDAIGTEGYAEHIRIADAIRTMPGTTSWDIITTKQITKKLVPLKNVIEMKYFHDISITKNTSLEASKQRGSHLKPATEYALATVDTVTLANDAESTNQITFRLKGRDYTALLTKVEEKTYDSGSWLKWYTGTIVDDHNNPVAGKVKFSVGDKTVTGEITIWSDSPFQEIYDFEEVWRQEDGQIVHFVHNRDKTLEEWKHGSGKPFDVVIYETPAEPTPSHSPQSSTNKTTIQSNITGVTASTAVGGTSTTTIDIFAVYDTEFKNRFSNPAGEIDKMIIDVNTAFSPADVKFNIKDYQSDTATLSSTDKTHSLLCDLRTNYKSTRDSKKADVAFLFTGKKLGNDIGGGFQYSGSATNGYGLAMMVDDGGVGTGVRFWGTPTQRAVLTTHELGHNLNADHTNAYNWTDWWVFHKYTAMWPEWKGDEEQLEFSSKDNHGDSTHNNIQRIKDVKATVAGFQ